MDYLRQYQSALGLAPDGVIGKNTMRAMMADMDWDDPKSYVHGMGQGRHESLQFTRFRENLNYLPKDILKTFNTSKTKRFTDAQSLEFGRTAQHPANQKAIANFAYGNRGGNGNPASDEGWIYRGGMALQITFKDNWEKFFEYCGLPLDTDPQSLETNFRAYFLSIKFYFEMNKMDSLCRSFDAQSCLNVSRKVNVGTTNTTFKPFGWKEREVLTQKLASTVGLL